jgi:4-amino-4-deoxy-L-arabinose transferase-like glycosyltransferase
LAETFQADISPFYLIGRLLNIVYALLTICALFVMARTVFNDRVALLAVLFFVVNAMTLSYVHFVRTDIAAAFWGTLSIALLVQLADRPSIRNQVLSGAAIGFSIGTRYFMGVLVPVLLFVDLVHVLADRQRVRRRSSWLEIAAGGAAVLLFFAISSPYFFIHLRAALHDLASEARTTHLGADGLSPIGNLVFYLTDALNQSVAIPEALLAVVGASLIIARRQRRLYLLPVFVVVFLSGVAVQHLHWARWIIPVFPVLALLAAYAVHEILTSAWTRWNVQNGAIRAVLATVIVLAAIGLPLAQSISYTYQVIHPSTRLLARAWVVDNLPHGSRIVAEVYTAPQLEPDYVVLEPGYAYTDKGVEAYAQQGYQFIMVSGSIYGRFFAEPDRYPNQVGFYNNLFSNYRLLHDVEPDAATPGAAIRIYALTGAPP